MVDTAFKKIQVEYGDSGAQQHPGRDDETTGEDDLYSKANWWSTYYEGSVNDQRKQQQEWDSCWQRDVRPCQGPCQGFGRSGGCGGRGGEKGCGGRTTGVAADAPATAREDVKAARQKWTTSTSAHHTKVGSVTEIDLDADFQQRVFQGGSCSSSVFEPILARPTKTFTNAKAKGKGFLCKTQNGKNLRTKKGNSTTTGGGKGKGKGKEELKILRSYLDLQRNPHHHHHQPQPQHTQNTRDIGPASIDEVRAARQAWGSSTTTTTTTTTTGTTTTTAAPMSQRKLKKRKKVQPKPKAEDSEKVREKEREREHECDDLSFYPLANLTNLDRIQHHIDRDLNMNLSQTTTSKRLGSAKQGFHVDGFGGQEHEEEDTEEGPGELESQLEASILQLKKDKERQKHSVLARTAAQTIRQNRSIHLHKYKQKRKRLKTKGKS